MFNNKKGRIMRHPYLSFAVLSLAAAGAISITKWGQNLFNQKAKCITNMMKGMKEES